METATYDTHLHIVMPASLAAKVRRYAAERDVKLSEFVRMALRACIAIRPGARRAGFARLAKTSRHPLKEDRPPDTGTAASISKRACSAWSLIRQERRST